MLEQRYQPLKSIGRGGFGKTYLAEDIKKFGEQCVIKQFAPYRGNESESEKIRFRDEAKQLQRLGEHPQIPSLLAFFAERGYLYLVQQYIAGENLAEELERRGRFDEARIRDFLQDLLGILQVVHQQGAIHRDIKPYNIMRRNSDQKLVLIDFGISKQIEASPATGTSIGSLGYSPLEQLWGGKAYPASDLYSLGATAFYLLSGTSPHQILAMRMEETSPAHAHNWVEEWRTYVTQPLSASLSAVLDRLLRLDYKQRYQSASDVLSDLQSANFTEAAPKVDRLPLVPAPPPPPAKSVKPRSPSSSLENIIKLLASAALGASGLMLVLLLVTAKSPSPVGKVSQDLGDRPTNADAYFQRGKIRSASNNFQDALADFNRAIELQPTADSYNERGQVRNSLKDFQGAVADFDKAVEINPSLADAYYYRASAHSDLGNTDRALTDLNKAISLDQNNSLALIARGRLFLKQGNQTQALADFNRAVAADNRSAYAYMSRAELFASQNKRAEAIADYDRSILLDPSSSAYEYYQRGILHQELNQLAQAKSDFETTIKLARKEGKEQDYADAAVRLKSLDRSMVR